MKKQNQSEISHPVIYIRPSEHHISLNLHELWEYRDLLYLLIWRDIKLRYKQTVIGSAWAILQPFATMIVFTVIFGKLMKVPTNGIPYPVFAYAALVPWTYFTHAMTKSTHSLILHSELITKIYFPRLIVPLASVIAAFTDFLVSFTMLAAMMIWFKIIPAAAVLMIPFFMILVIATAFGVGLWLSALNVEYRDIQNALPFLTQLWLFITPVGYSANLIPESWQVLYAINPMAGVIEGFRWALLGNTQHPPVLLIMVSAVSSVVILITGFYFFRYREDIFADVV